MDSALMDISRDPGEESIENSGRRSRKSGRNRTSHFGRIDMKAKLEKSRQSARECRARKKLRYQYLEELVDQREKAVFALRDEVQQFYQWWSLVDKGQPLPPEALTALNLIKNE